MDLLFFCVLSCVCYILCASVYMCFVVNCWKRADLLALVCGVYCEFVTFPLVSWVRCGTCLYRFLIFAPLLTLIRIRAKIEKNTLFGKALVGKRAKIEKTHFVARLWLE